MKSSDFSYNLPEELIAQFPIEKRDSSRLLVLDKNTGEIEHKKFSDILDYLNEGDCLVVNNTRVIPARLYGEKVNTGAKIEFLLLKDLGNKKWEVMAKPGKRVPVGTEVIFGQGILKAKILDVVEDGNRVVEFIYDGVFNEILDKIGLMPLPPYIKEKLKDKERYQTVYSKYDGSAAAPTAGLHFTDELLNKIKEKGINLVTVILHVGIGTFRPVKVENVEDHKMHSEYYEITKETAELINETIKKGKRVITVGTTTCRVLETVANEEGFVKEDKGNTNIFIYPGYEFKVVKTLITNFHLPESTLLMLVSALAGKEKILNAYNIAVEDKYRFFSFGDAMLIKDK